MFASLFRNFKHFRQGVFFVTLLYGLGAALWIGASDWLLDVFFDDPDLLVAASAIKGLLFVLVTALLLYGLLSHREQLKRIAIERREQAEAARQAAERARLQADTANQAKTAFLANMSHEIRTPMDAILGLTYLLQQSRPRSDQAARLSQIQRAASHLLALLNDILDLSKIEAGKFELEQSVFHLSTVLDEVQSLIKDQAKEKNLTVEIDPDDVPTWLCGDPIRVRQALLNYASNAVKFTEYGKITLRAKLLQSQGERLRLRFEVEDTGMGVAAESLPNLFEAFAQGDASTTRRHGGTGLGLTITRRLAQMMEGDVGVASEVGQGSRFWFDVWLRRAAPPQQADQRAAQTASPGLTAAQRNAHILLVEDHPINREVIAELLHSAELHVEPAGDGREALNKLRQQPFDLVLMDVQMPQMDGLEATRALRAQPEYRQLPVLAMTANAFAEDRQACLAAGMNDFIAKPVEPETLLATLAHWLPARPAAATSHPDGRGPGV